MHIYIVNGAPGAGKTTFETLVRQKVGSDWVFILSTIDPIKQAAKLLGWTGVKDPKARKFLSDLKDLANSVYDISYRYIANEINRIEKSFSVYDMPTDDVVVFIDSREPWDIQRLSFIYNAKTILIKRVPDADNAEILNHADRDVELYDYDIYIENDGDLEKFSETVDRFIEVEGIKRPSR